MAIAAYADRYYPVYRESAGLHYNIHMPHCHGRWVVRLYWVRTRVRIAMRDLRLRYLRELIAL